jgi:hypothetical protein
MARRQHNRCPFPLGFWHTFASRSNGKYPKSNGFGLGGLQLNGERMRFLIQLNSFHKNACSELSVSSE